MLFGVDHPVSTVTARILGNVVDSVDQKISGPADGAEIGGQFSRRNHHDLRHVVDRRQTPVVGKREHVKASGRILAGNCLRRKVAVAHRRVGVQCTPKPLTGTLKNVDVQRHTFPLLVALLPTAEHYTRIN